MTTIKELQEKAHQNAINKGWRDKPITTVEELALIACEVSEAIEEVRNNKKPNEIYEDSGKLNGLPPELADIVIRVMSFCGFYQIDLEAAILEKMAHNSTRPYLHGGKKL